MCLLIEHIKQFIYSTLTYKDIFQTKMFVCQELTEEGLPFLILFHHPDDEQIVETFNKEVVKQLIGEKSKFGKHFIMSKLFPVFSIFFFFVIFSSDSDNFWLQFFYA